MQVLCDFALICLVVLGVAVGQAELTHLLMPNTATNVLPLAAAVFAVNSALGFYKPWQPPSLTNALARGLMAALAAVILAYLLLRLLPPGSAPDSLPAAAMAIGISGVIVHRVYAAYHARSRTQRRILILGSGPAAQLVGQTLRAADPFAVIVGYCRTPNEQSAVAESDLLEVGSSLASTAARLDVDEIVVALSERRGGTMPMVDLLDCRVQGIGVCDISTYFEKQLGQIRVNYLNPGWLIFGDGFNQRTLRRAVKRAFDMVVAAVLIVVTLPLMLITACLIRLESRGPVLYRQERVGCNGVPFGVIKFRSMRQDAEQGQRPQWATKHDSRVTRVGRVIRVLRIDELPQLFNVLAGHMSMVGPRPERPFFVDQLLERVPYYAVRHSVKPGITGWAQVRYHYGGSIEDAQEKLQYDLYYVKNNSLFLDLMIILETVVVVLTGRGAR